MLGLNELEMFSNISCCQNNRLTSSKVIAVTKIQPEFQAMPWTDLFLDLKRNQFKLPSRKAKLAQLW